MKTFVLLVSKTFPKGHPKEGQETDFRNKLFFKFKKHTIRGNYDYWKKIIDQVNSKEAVLSIRQWSGEPYKSSQVEIGVSKSLGYQEIYMDKHRTDAFDIVWQVDGREPNAWITELAKNDGLDYTDFCHWFFKEDEQAIYRGIIIHFTALRY